ncbi:hypothetical protein V9L05_03985 [Bernardetia sp. Wsw4-3y2]|uniref:hypothetical protein n=1 Tax=Bernardetia sp. Wsw4-3y2 TaxID=3127471 RepID=UPI0030CC3FE7
MADNYFDFDLKNRIIFLFFLCCIGISQNTNALSSFADSEFVAEKRETKISKTESNRKNKHDYQKKSTKKTIFKSKNTKSNTKVKKISFRKKLSILKLVLKNKPSNKKYYRFKESNKSIKRSTKWNGQHTAGLLSWASVLVAVMAFFTGYFLLGIFASCSAILFLFLIFVEKGNKGTVDNVLWLFSQIINIIVIIGTIFD